MAKYQKSKKNYRGDHHNSNKNKTGFQAQSQLSGKDSDFCQGNLTLNCPLTWFYEGGNG